MGHCSMSQLTDLRQKGSLTEGVANLPKGGGMAQFLRNILSHCSGKMKDLLSGASTPPASEPKKPEPSAEKPKEEPKVEAKKEEPKKEEKK